MLSAAVLAARAYLLTFLIMHYFDWLGCMSGYLSHNRCACSTRTARWPHWRSRARPSCSSRSRRAGRSWTATATAAAKTATTSCFSKKLALKLKLGSVSSPNLRPSAAADGSQRLAGMSCGWITEVGRHAGRRSLSIVEYGVSLRRRVRPRVNSSTKLSWVLDS